MCGERPLRRRFARPVHKGDDVGHDRVERVVLGRIDARDTRLRKPLRIRGRDDPADDDGDITDSSSLSGRPLPRSLTDLARLSKKRSGIETHGMADSGVVGHVQPSLAPLKLGNLGLIGADFSGKVPLRHADLFSLAN